MITLSLLSGGLSEIVRLLLGSMDGFMEFVVLSWCKQVAGEISVISITKQLHCTMGKQPGERFRDAFIFLSCCCVPSGTSFAFPRYWPITSTLINLPIRSPFSSLAATYLSSFKKRS